MSNIVLVPLVRSKNGSIEFVLVMYDIFRQIGKLIRFSIIFQVGIS